MFILSPYYFSVTKAVQITGCSREYIESLVERGEIRSKKVPVLFGKEKGLVKQVHLGDIFDFAKLGRPIRKEERERIIIENKKKLKRSFATGVLVVIFFVVSGFFIRPIERISTAFFSPDPISLYTQSCKGGWKSIENLDGPPQVEEKGGIFDFLNKSAIYTGGAENLRCGDFNLILDKEEGGYLEGAFPELRSKDFLEASVNFSFASIDKNLEDLLKEYQEREEERRESSRKEEDEKEEKEKKEEEEEVKEKEEKEVEDKKDDEKKEEEEEVEDKDIKEEEKDEEKEGEEEEKEVDKEEEEKVEEEEKESDDKEEKDKDEKSEEEKEDIDDMGEEKEDEAEADEEKEVEKKDTEKDEEKDEKKEEEVEDKDMEEEEDEDDDKDTEEEEEEDDNDKDIKEEEQASNSLYNRFKGRAESLLGSIMGRGKEVFAESGEEESFYPDTKIVVHYTIDGKEWKSLTTFSGIELSNALKGGYFFYEIPEAENWKDIENFQIRFEGVAGGDTVFTAFLDSVWLEVSYKEPERDRDEFIIEGEKDHWKANEIPSYKIIKKEKRGFLRAPEEAQVPFGELNIDISVYDSQGNHQKVEIDSQGNIYPREGRLKPGKYKVRVEIEEEDNFYILEREFTWGVLAINFDQSVYGKEEDKAYIQMGVLDDEGHTICDANLEMRIINESLGIEDYLSTGEGTIKYSGVCAGDSYVEIPDYYTHYELPKMEESSSEFLVELTAHTKNGTRTIEDSFFLKEETPLNIRRSGPTRIFPPADYEMIITLEANEYFEGEVIETVPQFFDIKNKTDFSFEKIEEENRKKLIWKDLKLEEGEVANLIYEFNAPDISPEFYLLGPARLDGKANFFVEKRSWQIASDDPGTTEDLYPIEEISTTNLSGDIEYLQYNPSSLDARNEWYTQTAIENNELHVELDSPSGHISGTQTIRFLVRRTNNSTRVPEIEIELYQDGQLIETLETGRDIDSTGGTVWTYTFETDSLNDTSGENLEIVLNGERTGGAPGDRNVPEYGAIEWRVSLTGVMEETAPEDTVAGEVIGGPPEAFVGDSEGNPVEGVDVTVSVEGADFTPESTLTVESGADGIATFDNLIIEQSGEYQLIFDVQGVEEDALSSFFEILPDEPDYMEIETHPQDSIAGAPLEGPPQVILRDQFGNPVLEDYEVTVEVEGTDFLPESTTTALTDENGIATFDNLLIGEVGEYYLTFSKEGLTDIDSDPFDIIPADPDEIFMETEPEETVAGEVIGGPPQVYLEDQFGNPVSQGHEVEVEISEGEFASESTTTALTNEDGIATFDNLIIEQSGEYQLIFDVQGVEEDALSSFFEILPDELDYMEIETHPQDSIAGESLEGPPQVVLRDQFGNPVLEDYEVTVEVEGTDFLPESTTTALTDENGIATFDNLLIGEVGEYYLTFSKEGLTDIDSNLFNISPAEADSITVITQPQHTIYGEIIEGPPTVEVEDGLGNPVIDINVQVSLSQGDFTPESTTTVSTNQEGVAVFNNLTTEDPGIFYLTFNVEDIYQDSDDFEVEQVDIGEVLVETQPQNTTAGEAIEGPPEVYVESEAEEPIFGIGVKVYIQGTEFTPESTVNVTTNESGIATFDNLFVEEAGIYQLEFDVQGFPTNIYSNHFEVLPGGVDAIKIETHPQDTIAGEVIEGPPQVGVVDPFGNIVEEEDWEIEVILLDGDFATGSTTTALTNEDGIATFDNLLIEQSGVYELEFSVQELEGEIISDPFEIIPADPDSMEIETHPGETVAGEALEGPPQVLLRDQFGNPVLEDYEVTVEVEGTDFLGKSTTTALTNEDGIATFDDLFIGEVGEYYLTFSKEGLTDIDSDPFEIIPADPDEIFMETQPQETVAGEIIGGPPQVILKDRFDNPVRENHQVTVEVSGTSFASGSNTSALTNEDGIATFDNLSVEKAGTRYLIFSSQGVSQERVSQAFEIIPDSPDGIKVKNQPQDTTAGELIVGPPSVVVIDQYENEVKEEDIEVEVFLEGADFTTGSTTTVLTNENGIAAFHNLVIEQSGVYEIEFVSDELNSEVFSALFEIFPDVPDSVSVETQPEDSIIGGFLVGPPAALVEDQFGNPVDGIEVTADIYGEGTLGGARERNTGFDGIATFNNIFIEQSGTYQLEFSVEDVSPNAISDEFEVRDRIYPYYELNTSNLSGSINYLRYDPYSADASNDWYTANSPNSPTTLEVRLDDPPGHLSGTQTIRFLIRRTDNSAGNIPTVEIDLYQNGEFITTLEEGRNIESAQGEVWEYEFEAEILDDISGEDIDLLITSSTVGGGPNANVAEYGAIEMEISLAGIAVIVHPEDVVAGEIIEGPPTVIVEDDAGNPIVGINVTVNTFEDPEIVSGETVVPTDEDGIAVFDDLVIEEAGVNRLIFNAEGIFIDGVSNTFVVEPADPDYLEVEIQPQDSVVGQVIGGYPRVRLEDEFGNVIEGKDITVKTDWSEISEGSTTTVSTNQNGVAIFDDLVVERSGTFKLIFEVEGFNVEVESDYFEIEPGDIDGIAFYEEPVDTTAGEVIGGPPMVVLIDQFGNAVGVPNVEIHISVEGTSFASGTLIRSTNMDGVANFNNLVIEETGVYELEATAPEIEESATSYPFEITPADPDSLTITIQPEETLAMTETVQGPPTVLVEDQFGNPAEGAPVTVDITGSDFTPGSTKTVNVDSQGEAVFDNLYVVNSGTYQLIFSVEGVDDKYSDPFDVIQVFELDVTSNEGGSVDVSWEEGGGVVSEGQTNKFYIREDHEVTLEAMPGEGYVFDEWTGDYNQQEQITVIVMDDHKALEAHFREVMNIYGRVFEDQGNTPTSQELNLSLAVGGSLVETTQTSSSDGTYQFTEIAVPDEDQFVTVFLDEEGMEEVSGATITRHSGDPGTFSDFDVYFKGVIIRQDSESPVVNDGMDHFASNEIPFEVIGNDLHIKEGHKLIISGGAQFLPGGEITTPVSDDHSTMEGDLEIKTGGTLNMEENNLNIGGSFYNQGTFLVDENQVTSFNAISSGHHLLGNLTGNSSLGNIQFIGENGRWSFINSANVRGDFDILEGEVVAPGSSLSIGGDYLNQRGFDHNQGTVNFVSDSPSLITTGGEENPFHNINFENESGQWSLLGDLLVEGSLNLNEGTFIAGENQITFTGSGTPFLVNGTFQEDNSTVRFRGTSNSQIPSISYYYFETGPSSGSPNYTLTGGSFLAEEVTLLDRGGSATLTGEANNPTFTINGDLEIEENQSFSTPDTVLVDGSFYNQGTFISNTGTVTFTSSGTEEIVDGGWPFYDIVFSGQGEWYYKDGSSTAPNSTLVEDGEVNLLNVKTGTSTVTGGVLHVDWYLGIHVVAKGNQDYDIETLSESITVSENSPTPEETIFLYEGENWGSPSSQKMTETGEEGINPQPDEIGALRIREYTMTSSETTTYLYNLSIDNQPGFIFYDYYDDQGENYVTSLEFGDAQHDNVIGSQWHRENPEEINGEKPYLGLDSPPAEGTWYVGMESDLTFTAGPDVHIGELNEFNVWTNEGISTLTVNTLFPGGYTTLAWADYEGRMRFEEEEDYIDRFSYDNDSPGAWDGTCDSDNQCGFGYTTESSNLPGGQGDRFTNPLFCNSTESHCFAGFSGSEEEADPVAYSDSPTEGDETTNIIYRLSASSTTRPGDYSTTIFFLTNVNY